MPTKTRQVLYTLAETAINTVTNGSAVTLTANAVTAAIDLYFAQVTTTAPAAGTNLIVQAHVESSGNEDQWVDLAAGTVGTGTTAAVTTTANGAISANATSITLTGSGTFGARTKLLYFRDSATAGEWVRAQAQATTTLTIPSPGIVNSHLTGIGVYDQAVEFTLLLDVTGYKRLRVVVDNNTQATGPTVAVFGVISDFVA